MADSSDTLSKLMLVFGYVPVIEGERTRQGLMDLATALTDGVGREILAQRFQSYNSLETAILNHTVDVAWLPPLMLARLARGEHVVPAASCQRAGSGLYHACVIVRADSLVNSIDELENVRAGWVDRSSTSGFLLPRRALRRRQKQGVNLFSQELFFQTHAEVVRAVVSGEVDIGATFALKEKDGRILRGGWTDPDGRNPRPVRVLATFGPIPNDVLAIRSSLPSDVAERVVSTILSLGRDHELRAALRHLFGAEQFCRVQLADYQHLIELAEDSVESDSSTTDAGE